MPRPRFERIDAARRGAILDAAASEFGDQGFERASYNRIIERAGLSKGAMYYYFDDKDDLLSTVVHDVVGEFDAELGILPGGRSPERFWAEFADRYRAFLAVVRRKPRVAAFMPALVQLWRQSDKPPVLMALYGNVEQFVSQILARGREAGAVRDDVPEDLLRCVLMALLEATDPWLVRRFADDHADPEQSIAVVLGFVRRMLSP